MPDFPTYPSPGLPVQPELTEGEESAVLWDWLFQAPGMTAYPVAISGAYRTWVWGEPAVLQAFLFGLETVGWHYYWYEVGDIPTAPANGDEFMARDKHYESSGADYLSYPSITITNNTSHPIYSMVWEKMYNANANERWATTTKFSDGSYYFQSVRIAYNAELNRTYFEAIMVGFSYTVGWYRRYEYVRPAAVPSILPIVLPLLLFPLLALTAGAVVSSSGGTPPPGRRRKA